MATQSLKSLVCPVVVGRARELEALQRHLEGAGQGVLLLSGEAGVGKSRLAAEARQRAADLGVRVVQGSCFETDRSLPFGPLLDLLRFLVEDDPEDLARALDPSAEPLTGLLPELAPLLPSTIPRLAFEPEQQKRRLFHVLAGVFRRLAGPAPLLVILEDLHWSDDTSLEFLLYLTQRRGEQPLTLLLTYRTDEGHPSLGRFLAGLDRQRLASELPLDSLPAADVAEMIRAIFRADRPVHAEFLRAIYTLTEGNPFFVEEALQSVVGERDASDAAAVWAHRPTGELRIPRSVQDAVRRRSERLGPRAREVLTLAAVAGRRFDFALLQDLAGLDEH
jgi:predicted ATPase